MKNMIRAMHSIAMLILKASLGIFVFNGVLPTLQASTKIDPERIHQIENIRLRLLENDTLSNGGPNRTQVKQAEEHVARWFDTPGWPDWSTWNNWGNGWRNY